MGLEPPLPAWQAGVLATNTIPAYYNDNTRNRTVTFLRPKDVLLTLIDHHYTMLPVGRAGLEPATFTTRVPDLQSGAFTIRLPTVMGAVGLEPTMPKPRFYRPLR